MVSDKIRKTLKIEYPINCYSIEDIIERLNSVERLEKALDKACDELESLDYKLKMKEASPCSYDCDYIHAEEWKKELLK